MTLGLKPEIIQGCNYSCSSYHGGTFSDTTRTVAGADAVPASCSVLGTHNTSRRLTQHMFYLRTDYKYRKTNTYNSSTNCNDPSSLTWEGKLGSTTPVHSGSSTGRFGQQGETFSLVLATRPNVYQVGMNRGRRTMMGVSYPTHPPDRSRVENVSRYRTRCVF